MSLDISLGWFYSRRVGMLIYTFDSSIWLNGFTCCFTLSLRGFPLPCLEPRTVLWSRPGQGYYLGQPKYASRPVQPLLALQRSNRIAMAGPLVFDMLVKYYSESSRRGLHKTACAPSARALMMSLPVRIPESKKTVSWPEAWAALIVGDFMIVSNASNAGMAPSTCRPPNV